MSKSKPKKQPQERPGMPASFNTLPPMTQELIMQTGMQFQSDDELQQFAQKLNEKQ